MRALVIGLTKRVSCVVVAVALLMPLSKIGVGPASAQEKLGIPGEFIIRREVPYRPAIRTWPPVPPVSVSVSPEEQIQRAIANLGAALTDEQSALIATGNALSAPDGFINGTIGGVFGQDTLQGNRVPILSGTLGRTFGPSSGFMRSLTGLGDTIARAVGGATRAGGSAAGSPPGIP